MGKQNKIGIQGPKFHGLTKQQRSINMFKNMFEKVETKIKVEIGIWY